MSNKQVQKNKKIETKTMKWKSDKLSNNCTLNVVEGNSVNKNSLEKIVQEKPSGTSRQPTRVDDTFDVTEKPLRKALSNAEEYSNLSLPGLCSALQLASEIQLASIDTKKPKQSSMPLERNKMLKQKVSRKVTVPFNKHIFSNLADFHINDADIFIGKSVGTKSEGSIKNYDDLFVLSNFYKPDFSTQLCVHVQNQKVCKEKVQFFSSSNVFSCPESSNN